MSSPQRCPVDLFGRWGENPPPPKLRKFDVYHVDPGKVHELVVICSFVESVMTHWMGDRTQKCTGKGDDCWCSHAIYGSPRWQGWLAVCRPKRKVIELVRMTPCAMACDQRFKDSSHVLRGHTIEIYRLNNKSNGEVSARIRDDIPLARDMPLEPNMRLAVERLLAAPDRPKQSVKSQIQSAMRTRTVGARFDP